MTTETGEPSEQWMFLDPHDSHLDARVERDGCSVDSLHTDGFQYLWKGVRANYGIVKGVYMYEVKILENHQVQMPETKVQNHNILRCGFSQPLTSLFLGDTAEGWGWGGTGKKSHNNQFADYGGAFGIGDVLGCVVDMDQSTISFLKNGEFMGVAYDNIPPAAAQTGVFPHVLMKNVKVQLNFRRESKWFDPPGPQVKFFEEAGEADCVANPIEHPASLAEAEFILMAGLPACGKTYWAQKHMEANPLKNYVMLGTNAVIDQMKVVSLNRQRNYADRWQELISQATPIFNKLVEIAGRTPRNIILDQTNVYKNARSRKARAFGAFGTRICMTLVIDQETLEERTGKREREEGKFVPVDVVNDMAANFVAPELQDGFTELSWPELPEREARQAIMDGKNAGMDWKRRNPGAGKGNMPKPRLENREANTIGKGAFKDQKPPTGNAGFGAWSGGKGGAGDRGDDRSRSPAPGGWNNQNAGKGMPQGNASLVRPPPGQAGGWNQGMVRPPMGQQQQQKGGWGQQQQQFGKGGGLQQKGGGFARAPF